MEAGTLGGSARWIGASAALAVALAAPAAGQGTQRASLDSSGSQGNSASTSAAISADGRWVVFTSVATNLVPGDTNSSFDVFVRDTQAGTTERVSVDSAGAQGAGNSYFPSISADGRYVAFHSAAPDLVPGDTNARYDVFVRDRQLGTTERVSVDSGGTEGNDESFFPSISADGRHVSFQSRASNLVAGDTNGFPDVFVRDLQLGTTERVSVDSGGAEGNEFSRQSSISADGRYVAFESLASNLVPGDTNASTDVFLRDRQLGTTERLSVDSNGVEHLGEHIQPSISADGRCVAFLIFAGLAADDSNMKIDVYVRDRLAGTIERVSLGSSGTEGDNNCYLPSISADGRHVAFQSWASDLVPGDTNAKPDVFARDRLRGTTERVSVDSAGAEGNNGCDFPAISPDGRWVAFASDT